MPKQETEFSLISDTAKKVVHQDCTFFVSTDPDNKGFSYLDSKGRNGSTIRLYPEEVRQTIHSMDQGGNNGHTRVFDRTSENAEILRALYQRLLSLTLDM